MTRDRISKLETESIQLSQSLNNSKGRDWRKNEQSQRPMGQYQIVQHTYHWNPRRRGRRRRGKKRGKEHKRVGAQLIGGLEESIQRNNH